MKPPMTANYSSNNDTYVNAYPTMINMYIVKHTKLLQYTAGYVHDTVICDRACKNQPCELKLYQVIFLLISSVLNVVSNFCTMQKKAH